MRRLGAGLLVAAAVCLTAAPAASAGTLTARRGSVSATVSFTGSGFSVGHVHLQILRSGQIAYSRAVTGPPRTCGRHCQPQSLRILPLQAGREPQVVVDLWTGGANCCTVDEVFTWAPAARAYARSTAFLGEGAALRDLDHRGRYEFVAADYAFKYRFTDGAASGQPIRVLRFSAGHFLNVTRRYPKLIARDAAGWLAAYRSMAVDHWRDSVGVIAAWAADEDELGRSGQVASYLNGEAAAGHLNGPLESGVRFIADLNRFLRRTGYLR